MEGVRGVRVWGAVLWKLQGGGAAQTKAGAGVGGSDMGRLPCNDSNTKSLIRFRNQALVLSTRCSRSCRGDTKQQGMGVIGQRVGGGGCGPGGWDGDGT